MFIEFSESEIADFLEADEVKKELEQNKLFEKLLSIKNKIAIFNNIEAVELKSLLYDINLKTYKKDEIIIKDGDDADYIYYILSGKCEIIKEEKKLATLSSGDTFGEIAVVCEIPRISDVKSISDNTVLLAFKIDLDNLDFCAKPLAIFYKNLALEMQKKLQKLNDEFISKVMP